MVDADELCPGTTAGLVDSNGCSDAQVDGDRDGFCDPGAPSGGPSGCTGTDDFPNSNTDETVLIGGCEPGVNNLFVGNGASFDDLIGVAADNPKNHGDFDKKVSKMASRWKKDGLISGKEKSKIISCAAKADIP